MTEFICKRCGLCCQWLGIPFKGVASKDVLQWYKDRGIIIHKNIMWIPSICPNLSFIADEYENRQAQCNIHLTKNQICKKGNCQQQNALPQEP